MSKNLLLTIIVLFIINGLLYSQDTTVDIAVEIEVKEQTSDLTWESDEEEVVVEEPEEFDWMEKYITVDPSDDIFYGYKLKHYTPEESYVKNLKWRHDVDFYIPGIDKFNLRQNINNLPRFPFLIIPMGNLAISLSGNTGIDLPIMELGFLFRHDNINNSRFSFTAAGTFSQNDKLYLMNNFEYLGFLPDDRLRVFSTLAFFTSGPQYSAEYLLNSENDTLTRIIASAFRSLATPFAELNSTGFTSISGADFRIPLFDLNTVTAVEFSYQYNAARILSNDSFPPKYENRNDNQFNINIIEEFKWDKLKQTSTIAEGNHLSLFTKFHLPTHVGAINKEFRFQSRLEERLSFKFYREFAFKGRLLLAANYNLSQDFSGEPYVRAVMPQELTGFFALIANAEVLLPLMNINIKKVADKKIRRFAPWILYGAVFVDLGFTLENDRFLFDGVNERADGVKYIDTEKHGPLFFNDGYYMIPAFSAGFGLRAHPYFMHFIVRLDFSLNIMRAILKQEAPPFQIAISFNDMF